MTQPWLGPCCCGRGWLSRRWSRSPASGVLAPQVFALGPLDVLPPSISGSPQQGQTVSCSTGTWLGSPTSYAYAWQRGIAGIGGAATNQYVLSAADVGQLITCRVIASNIGGASLPATSLPVTPLGLPVIGQPVNVVPPSISGSPQQGQTVSCSSGTWLNSPASYAYSWQRDGTSVAATKLPARTDERGRRSLAHVHGGRAQQLR